MRPFRVLCVTILPAALLHCRGTGPVAAFPQPCPRVEESALSREWDPRSLAGQYRIQWVTDTEVPMRTSSLRLFLWKTSMIDSSPSTHIHPAVGDTVLHPLYGVLVPDTGSFSRARVEQMRAAIDPIFPPVLLLARVSTSPTLPVRDWTVLLIGTVSNRRDDAMVLDGAGIGMWVRQADSNQFRGFFEPWGIVVDDKGHYCAQRIPP